MIIFIINLSFLFTNFRKPNINYEFQAEASPPLKGVGGMNYFKKQGYGHLVNISSIAGMRGNGIAPSYNSSKAYQINYLEGLRLNASKSNSSIYVTDVRPGFVDTAMAKGDGLFWVSPVEKAAEQIYAAIKRKKKVVYISKRWRLIGYILKAIPYSILARL